MRHHSSATVTNQSGSESGGAVPFRSVKREGGCAASVLIPLACVVCTYVGYNEGRNGPLREVGGGEGRSHSQRPRLLA